MTFGADIWTLLKSASQPTQIAATSGRVQFTDPWGLIPIQRLSVPQGKDQQPLVQWDTDDSEEDIVNFFPLSRKETRIHQELTDTFSIEEMSISGDDEEEEDLHLVPPQTNHKRFKCCPISMCTII
nr:unnamed protein product [Callosobruchus analis]